MSKKPPQRMKFRHVGIALVAVALIAALVGLAVQRATRYLEGAPRYQVTLESIELSPPPKWIRSDVRAEALRDASLDLPVSILEPELAEKIAHAFALHPWVAEVQRVEKLAPGTIRVELTYRRPVCMVQVTGGAFAVDAEGVLLPSDDFSPAEAQAFPFVTGIQSTPQGGVGNVWGDAHVAQAAAVAALLRDVWTEWDMNRISIVRSGAEGSRLVLQTNLAARIVWGLPDGETGTAADKLARLQEYFSERGTFGQAGSTIDLTQPGPLQPRTAAQREPQSPLQ